MLRAQLASALEQAWPELEIVAEAENGEQAIALAGELEPDIAFLDIRMPVKDGLEVASRNRRRLPRRVRHRLRRIRGHRVRAGRRRLCAEAGAADRIARMVDRLKQRCRAPPADLANVLQQLAVARARRTAALDQGVARQRRCD